jgi:fatty-acyl-CoA synthase
MESTVMDFPLTIQHISWRAENLFRDRKIVSRSIAGTSTYSYADCFSRARKLASALSTLGVKEGELVGSIAWNHREHLELYLATTLSHRTLHTTNVRFHPSEMERVIIDAGDRALFFDSDVAKQLAERRSSFKGVVGMVDFQSEDYARLVDTASEVLEFPHIDESDAAIMCNTSGTTGVSKTVVYSHRSVYLHSLTLLGAGVLAISENDRVLPVVPMFHISAWDIPFASLMAGATLVLPGPRPRPADLASLIEIERVTLAAAAPAVLIELVQHLKDGNYDISSLKTIVTGGAEPPVGLVRELQSRWGVSVVHVWGMTETEAISSVNRASQPEQVTRQGVPMPGLEMRVVDNEGNELPWDGTSKGVLQVRGPWVSGSYVQREANEKSFVTTAGKTWLVTGDIVTIDQSGSIKLVDREKDLIRSGAESISSIDLENSLMTHPGVLEAAVVARPDPKWGERPFAFVVIRKGLEGSTTTDVLKLYLSSLNRYPKWWIPDDFRFIDAIPKTSTGKMDKKSIRKLLDSP